MKPETKKKTPLKQTNKKTTIVMAKNVGRENSGGKKVQINKLKYKSTIDL
jgi:hypothetical protein